MLAYRGTSFDRIGIGCRCLKYRQNCRFSAPIEYLAYTGA
jgi:hypothetical protein